MEYIKHAATEFRAAGWTNEDGSFKDEMQQELCEQVVQLLGLFDSHGHSGSTAPYAINLFKTLAAFEPLVPLTGEDWEWFDHGNGMHQNKRCGHVFKDVSRFDGQPYDIEAIVFYDIYKDEETGEEYKSHFTNWQSAQPVTFPYTPTRVYRERTPELNAAEHHPV